MSMGVAAFGLLTIATSREPLEPVLLFDGESYLALARQIRDRWFFPPPSMNLRPPLYPTVLAVAGWLTGSDGQMAVRNLQMIVWVLMGLLVASWVYRVGGSALRGGLTGCLYYTLASGFANIQLIYAETITTFLAVAAGLALSSSMMGDARAQALRWAAALLALGSIHGRPVFQVLLPMYAAFAAGPLVRGRTAVVRHLVPFVVAALVGVVPFYLVHAIVKGSPSFVAAAGHSLANYLGDRRLLGEFPPGYEAVEAFYSVRFAADPKRTIVPWWEVDGDWRQLIQARTGREPSWGTVDRSMGVTTLAVLSRNPGYYVTRWLETWWEFSTTPAPPVVGPGCPIALVYPLWVLFWTSLGAWLPFAILAVEVAHVVRRGPGALVRLVPISAYLAVGLLNTAIEPWPGQIRYRAQVEVFLVIALGLTAGLAWTWARAAARRWRDAVA